MPRIENTVDNSRQLLVVAVIAVWFELSFVNYILVSRTLGLNVKDTIHLDDTCSFDKIV